MIANRVLTHLFFLSNTGKHNKISCSLNPADYKKIELEKKDQKTTIDKYRKYHFIINRNCYLGFLKFIFGFNFKIQIYTLLCI